jgi:hypothetical protein
MDIDVFFACCALLEFFQSTLKTWDLTRLPRFHESDHPSLSATPSR